MKIRETVNREREVYVAPCIKCGSQNIVLSDCGYSSFNCGGGQCLHCGFKVSTGNLGCSPTPDELAKIWNADNDLPTLIKKDEALSAAANARIAQYKLKMTTDAWSDFYEVKEDA